MKQIGAKRNWLHRPLVRQTSSSMLIRTITLGIFTICMIIMSCTQSQKNDAENRRKAIAQTAASLDSIRNTRLLLPDDIYPLTTAYWQYYEDFKEDTLSPYYLYKAAEWAVYIQQGIKAISYLKRIEQEYPNYSDMSNVMFLTGFIYDNEVKDFDNAKKYYTLFLEKYPEHPLANDTGILIQNLGKSPEDLIKEFEAKNAQ